MYSHRDETGQVLPLPVGKAVCVGRNYQAHIEELNNTRPVQPLLFIKPATSLCDVSQPICIPQDFGACHNELEVAILITREIRQMTVEACSQWLACGEARVGLALDLTLRDVQSDLKQKSLPWERAKGFDGACPVSSFSPLQHDPARPLQFYLEVNGEVRQQGNSACMIWSVAELLSDISRVFTLQPGDIVLTGTPEGVGPLHSGDRLTMRLDGHVELSTTVV